MLKLIIEKIDGYSYYLSDELKNIYKFNIEFYDLLTKPNVNDCLFINEKLLTKHDLLLSFGLLNNSCGRVIESIDNTDLIILIINNKEIYLKRLYG